MHTEVVRKETRATIIKKQGNEARCRNTEQANNKKKRNERTRANTTTNKQTTQTIIKGFQYAFARSMLWFSFFTFPKMSFNDEK